MNKIVVLDGYTLNPGDLSWKALEALGEVRVYDRTKEDEIIERIGDSDIVLTNKTVLTEETLKACPAIRYIGCMSTGYNVLDVRRANELGIVVTNIPAYGTEAVAQFTMALLLEITSQVEENEEMINKETIGKMKDGVILLNTGRGKLIREADLRDALNSGKVAGAGVDVASAEPVNPDNPLLHAKNLWMTPHIAWAALETRQRLMNILIENIRAFLRGEPINEVH